jgi:hypothetical protein
MKIVRKIIEKNLMSLYNSEIFFIRFLKILKRISRNAADKKTLLNANPP